jgi:hypothetical protein
VFWEEDSGRWATSSRFASTPWPEVESLIADRPTAAARGELWRRLLPPERYLHQDRAAGEPSAAEFPHPLRVPIGVPFAAVWDQSPWADEYLANLAITLVDRLALGRREATDLLAIGFSALDYVGHVYGPRSHEVQDMLVRLDRVLGRLLDALDRAVGPNSYVVALTSDHGVALLPEQSGVTSGGASGRISLNAIGNAVESALTVHLGRRRFIEAMTGTYVHFLPGILDQIRAAPAAAKAAAAAAEAVPGVERVFWNWDLASDTPAADERVELMRRSYVPGRSGDLAFQPERHWVVASAGTNHGTWHDYDSEVPLAFVGPGIQPRRHAAAATLADVAPTLGALAGVSLPRADGRALPDIVGPAISGRQATPGPSPSSK